MKKVILLFVLLFSLSSSYGQSLQSIVAELSLDSLVKSVRELSGEDSIIVNGNKVRITHRVNKKGNNLASDYLVERLNRYGLKVEEQNYSTIGRNVIATLTGKLNPDSILIVSAHYDAVTDYCADDNASSVSVALEIARLFSDKCFANTVKFCFWDEEEVGKWGSRSYADTAFKYGENITAVINFEMMGFDRNNDGVFDIHTIDGSKNQALKDTVLYLLDTLNIKLVPNIINPGTDRSDHASFWNKDFPAILIMENFLGGEVNPYYHSVYDRIRTFNLEYYYEFAKLGIGIITELAQLVPAEETTDTILACKVHEFGSMSITESGTYTHTFQNRFGCDSISTIFLTVIHINDSISLDAENNIIAIDSGLVYQWYNCDGGFMKIDGETNRVFTPTKNGRYAVEISNLMCKDTSDCIEIVGLGIDELNSSELIIYPNPTNGLFTVELTQVSAKLNVNIFSLEGQLLKESKHYNKKSVQLSLPGATGVYIIQIMTDTKSEIRLLIKE